MIKTEPKMTVRQVIRETVVAKDEKPKAPDNAAKENQKRKPTGRAKVAITLRLSPAAHKALMEDGGRARAEEILEEALSTEPWHLPR